MRWSAQVRHVMMKDLREMRWPLASYAAVVLLATAHALSLPGLTAGALGSAMLVIVLLGVTIIVSLVQSDSPTRADAFWASRPFYPTAMLAAKLSLALVVLIGVPLLGQLAGLMAWGVSAADVPLLLARSVWEYGIWLLAAMVIAAVTRDVLGVIKALVSIAVVFFVGTALLSSSVSSASLAGPGGMASVEMIQASRPGLSAAAVQAATFIVGVCGALAVLAVLYRTRDARRGTLIVTFLVTLCTLASVSPPWEARVTTVDDVQASAPHAVIRGEFERYDTLADTKELDLEVYVTDAPDFERLNLDQANAIVHLRNGSTIRVPVGSSFIPLGPSAPPPIHGVTWLRRQQRAPNFRMQVPLKLSPSDRDAVAAGVTSVTLDGYISATDPQIAGSIPLEQGASLIYHGDQVRIERWTPRAGVASMEIVESAVQRRSRFHLPNTFSSTDVVEFALVNDARGEAFPLSRGSSAGSTSWLVLPGTQVVNETIHLQLGSSYPVGDARRPDDAWLRGARLVIMDWVPRGSYPVHAEFVSQSKPVQIPP